MQEDWLSVDNVYTTLVNLKKSIKKNYNIWIKKVGNDIFSDQSMNESDEENEKPVKKDWLAVFRGMGYKWEGGKKDTAPGFEIDSYIPSNKVVIASLLLPLELAVKKDASTLTRAEQQPRLPRKN